MKKVRVSSWEMDGHLFAAVEAAKAKRGNKWTWRRMQSEGLRLLLASWGEPVAVAEDSGEVYAHAHNVERLPAPEVATQSVVVPALPASVVPASGGPAVGAVDSGEPINGSPNEKRLYWLLKSRARTQECLDAAPIELEKDPKSLRALNWLARMPGILEKQDAEIAECEAAIAAEKAAKENSSEVLPEEEV